MSSKENICTSEQAPRRFIEEGLWVVLLEVGTVAGWLLTEGTVVPAPLLPWELTVGRVAFRVPCYGRSSKNEELGQH